MGRVGVKDKKKTAHFNKKSQRIDTSLLSLAIVGRFHAIPIDLTQLVGGLAY